MYEKYVVLINMAHICRVFFYNQLSAVRQHFYHIKHFLVFLCPFFVLKVLSMLKLA